VEYPDLPTFQQTDSITVKAKVLRDMIRQTVYAVSDNNAKPIYTGSLFEIADGVLRIIAIDGFRMAIRSENVESESNTSFVVPGKTQQEVLKLLTDDDETINIIVGQRHITFRINSYSVISRLIEGTFLDYRSTIPVSEKTELVINTRMMIESVERMSLLNSERVPSPVRCKFNNNEIRLSCASAVGRASDEISVPIIGDSVEIGFNNRYLMDALRYAPAERVRLELNTSVSPCIITPVGGEDNFLYMVLPVRLKAQ
jgi:DNA polymerase-3 subunit beta